MSEQMYFAKLNIHKQKGVLSKHGDPDETQIIFAQYGDDMSGLKAMKAVRHELDALIGDFEAHLKKEGVL